MTGVEGFWEPQTLLGRLLLLAAFTVAPVMIFVERAHDLRQRAVHPWVVLAIAETALAVVICCAALIALVMLLVLASLPSFLQNLGPA